MKTEKILVASFQSLNKTTAGGIAQLGYKLADEFHKRHLLKTYVISSKGKFETSFPSSAVSYLSKYYLFAINNFGKYVNLKPYVSRYIQEKLYDHFCASHIDASVTKLVATTPYLRHTFSKARKLGIKIYFIPGNPEDNYIQELVSEENRKYNIKVDDAYTYKPRLDYYNKSMSLVDAVITYSSLMEKTYRNARHAAEIISVRGYLKPPKNLNTSEKETKNQKFKVAFLAYSVLLKGLQYVLEAWKDLQHEDMELHVGGMIDKNVQGIIQKEYSDLKNVYYHGLISNVASFFEDKSVYVLTSIIDGAPVTVLEAMRGGLPVILSENCGTKDIIVEGVTGWVIPIRDANAIKEKILKAYHNPDLAKEMGAAGKKIIDAYDMDNFIHSLADIITKN